MSLKSDTIPYSRVESDDIVPRLSVDLAQDAGLGYELVDGASSRSATSTTATAVERQDNLEPSGDDRVSHYTKSSSIHDEPDGPHQIPTGFFSTMKSWWRELLAISISTAALVSTAGVLLAYQNKPLSSWHFRYLPNSVISQLMTVSRSALMFSTASCVSQLAWLHIKQRPRALSDLQAFDNASRGPAGAITMLAFPTRYCVPALVGSLITLATLLMEPLSQQVLQSPLRSHIVPHSATYPTTQLHAPAPRDSAAGPAYIGNEANVNASIQAAIVNGIYNSPSADVYACNANATCSWHDTATLGICSACRNVTAATKQSCPQVGTPLFYQQSGGAIICNYTTPSDFMLQTNFFDTSAQQRYITRVNTSVRAGDGLLSFATLTWDWGGGMPDVHECQLSWCAKVLRNATAQGSQFSVRVDNHLLNATTIWDGPQQTRYFVYEADSDFPPSLNATFTIQEANSRALSDFLISMLRTGVLTEYQMSEPDMTKTFSLGTAILGNPSVSYMADNIAASLTNAMRNLTTDYIIQNSGDSTFQVQYIQVQWIWLAFPATIVLFGLLLLLATMVQSHLDKALVWKCSPLALLFHPLQGWNDDDLDHVSKHEMEKSAKGMRGQLMQGDNSGLRIVRT